MQHFISCDDLSADLIRSILNRATGLKKNHEYTHLRGHCLAAIAHDRMPQMVAATEAAMLRLGGTVINVPTSHSGVACVPDLLQTYSIVADALAVWIANTQIVRSIADSLEAPVLNCGLADESVAQGLIDLYTIRKELGRWEDIKLLGFGDIGRDPCWAGLMKLWSKLAPDNKVTIVERSFPSNLCEKKNDDPYDAYHPKAVYVQERLEQLYEGLAKADVVYVVEDEFRGYSRTVNYSNQVVMDELALTHMKKDAILLHPMPRGPEMDPKIDGDSRVRIWKQTRYGLPVVMALLERMMLG